MAYAQIAGLPPQAGLMAAPGALIAYALLVLGHDPLRLRVEGGLFYANSVAVKDHVLTLADGGPVELDLQASYDLDVQSLDTLAELDRGPGSAADQRPPARRRTARARRARSPAACEAGSPAGSGDCRRWKRRSPRRNRS